MNRLKTIAPRTLLTCFVAALLFIEGISAAARAADGSKIYTVFKSEDQGRSWARSDGGLPVSSRINALHAFGKIVLAGADTGIFMSQDSGQTWEVISGVASSSGRFLCFASLGQTLFAGTDGPGMLGSSDKGRTWRTFNQGLKSRKVRCLLALAETLYAGTDVDGVFQSRDGGKTWAPSNVGIPASAQIFSMAAVGKSVFAGLYIKGLYHLNEMKQTWEKSGDVTPLVLATVSDTLVAGHNPGGVFRSTDLGKSWENGSAGLPADAPIWAMASDQDRVFCGASDGIYFSEDRGSTWDRAELGLPALSSGIAFVLTEKFILAAAVIKK